MTDVLVIADEMLKVAKQNNKHLTPMKLVKILYIAHGFRLGRDDVPLFSNKIEAWKYGPIIPDLYRSTKKFGHKDIPFDLIGDTSVVSPEVRNFLEEVYYAYGHLSEVTLSYLTHQVGSPWDMIYSLYGQGENIPDETIKRYYEQKFPRKKNKND